MASTSEYRCIDTRVFDKCIDGQKTYVARLEAINQSYAQLISKMESEWKGKGADAFFDDAKKVRTNLRGITDILATMSDILKDCRSCVDQVDKQLGGYNREPDKE